jgi:DNA-directed RNA polymerase specialized sigma24 family protein
MTEIAFNPYPRARAVVRIALTKMNLDYYDVKEDYEDLVQEAAIALWKNANRFPDDEDQSRAYQFGAAIRETIKAYVRRLKGKNPWSCQLFECLEYQEPEENELLSPDILQALADIFLAARVQCKGRAVDAAFRDVAICALIFAGYNNKGIARTLGLKSWRDAKTYRKRIRQVLQDYLGQEKEINPNVSM